MYSYSAECVYTHVKNIISIRLLSALLLLCMTPLIHSSLSRVISQLQWGEIDREIFDNRLNPSYSNLCLLTFTQEDENGAIAVHEMANALMNGTPIICSPALLKISLDPSKPQNLRKGLLELFKRKLWFLCCDTSVDICAIVPKDFASTPEDYAPGKVNETLSSGFGFKENALHYVEPEDIQTTLDRAQKKSNSTLISVLRDSINPRNFNRPIMVYLTGHGRYGTKIADLDYSRSIQGGAGTSELEQLFSTLNAIGAQFLYISSCFTGGSNLPKIPAADFPVVVQATTDFITQGQPELLKLYLLLDEKRQKIDRQREKKLLISPSELSKILRDVLPYNIFSLAVIRFPGTYNFFRSAQLDRMEILTWLRLRLLQNKEKLERVLLSKLQGQKIPAPVPQAADSATSTNTLHIQIDNRIDFVCTYVRDMSNVAITIERRLGGFMTKPYPIFISQIPDKAHHFIDTLSYPLPQREKLDDSVETIDKQTKIAIGHLFQSLYPAKEFDQIAAPLSYKCWFIKKLELISDQGKKVTIKNLAVQPFDYIPTQQQTSGSEGQGHKKFSPSDLQRACYIYYYDNKYYFDTTANFDSKLEALPTTDEKIQKIYSRMYSMSKPSPEAVRMATAGNEEFYEIDIERWSKE